MLHGRRDYDHIQDPTGKIGEDEPVFILRAHDALAPAMLKLYADLLRTHVTDRAMVANVEEQAQRMRDWQAVNGKDYPDVLPGFYRAYTPPPPATEAAKPTERVVATADVEPERFDAPPGWKRDPATGQWTRTDLPKMPPDLSGDGETPAHERTALERVHGIEDSLDIRTTRVVAPDGKRVTNFVDAGDVSPEQQKELVSKMRKPFHERQSKEETLAEAYGGDPHGALSEQNNSASRALGKAVEKALNEDQMLPPDVPVDPKPLAEGAEKLMLGQPKEHKPVTPPAPAKPLNEET